MADIVLTDFTRDAIATLEGGSDRLIEVYATWIRDEFQSNVHVITGAMQASASVVTANGSDYAENVAKAAALNPKAEFAPQEQVGPGEAVVQVPVSYAAYEEFGTVHQAAHPALVPSVEYVVSRADLIARQVFGL